ncbi:MAG: transcriptional repressor [Armatimonadetes bacterium]|nr:transcriptional repressor [Armatimonadota bacterium]
MSSPEFCIADNNHNVEHPAEETVPPVLGQRSTRQRKLIYDILKSSNDHLSVEDLYRRARDIDSRVSLSTVYRTISLLKEASLVDELIFEDDRRCYEFKRGNGYQHHHIRCLSCGNIIEFQTDYARRLRDKVAEEMGFSVESLKIDVAGYCEACATR